MKRYFTLVVIGMLVSGVQAQNVLRVNNNPAAAAPYTNLQTAITASLAGDFIVVEGSATTYGDISINKPITISGAGFYFTGQTVPNPVNQANQLTSLVGNVTFSTGSDGAVIESLNIQGTVRNFISPNFFAVNDITIKRCYVANFNIGGTSATVQGPTTGWLMTQCLVNGTVTVGHATNFVITNTVLRSQISMHHKASINVVNSTFTAESFQTAICNYNSGEETSLAITNTIFFNNASGINLGIPSRGNSITFAHNLFRSTGISITSGTDVTELPADNGNQFNIDMNFVFQGAANNSADGRWRLAVNSPAIGAGVDGVDCGHFGGATPYVLSSIPSAPVVTKMSTSGGGTSASPLKVTVSATSNQ